MRYLAAFCLLMFAVPAFAVDTYDSARDAAGPVVIPGDWVPWERPQVICYDNCPYFNSAGTGVGGADESILQTSSCSGIPPGDWLDLNMNTLGFGHQFALGFKVADDFTVPAGESWNVTDFITYAYQTGGGPGASTITGVYVEVRDDAAGAPGNVIWGNQVDNIMNSTTYSNANRVSCTSWGIDNGRSIMVQESLVSLGTSGDLVLGAGTYWLAWQSDGSLPSGPWAPPCAIKNVGATGNGYQSLDAGATWAPALDSGIDGFPQGFPFMISCDDAPPTPTENTSWSNLKGTFTE